MITIDDPETERLANQLAARTGQSVEAAVQAAVRARAAEHLGTERAPPPPVSPEVRAQRRAALEEFARRMDALPVLDPRSADEIIGYDENGLPT